MTGQKKSAKKTDFVPVFFPAPSHGHEKEHLHQVPKTALFGLFQGTWP